MFASPLNAQTRGFNKTQPSPTMKNAAMLTLSELRDMKERCLINTLNQEQRLRLQEKKELKEMCDTRIKNWPDTIQAIRKKKEDTRFERFQVEEEERRKIDVEEAKYQASIKQDIIGKNNKLVYENNDRVKSFQSALLLSDALKEREAQLEINKRKKEAQKIIAEHYVELDKENMRRFDEKEEEKRLLLEEKKKYNEHILKNQHDDLKIKNIKRMQEEKIQGEIIKIQTKEALVQEKEEAAKRKQRLLDAQEETRKANEYLQELRQQEKLKELEKEREIEVFAQKKEEVMEMRKMREDLKFREKQAARQRIIDAQTERLKQIKDREDEILNKNIIEAEIKAEENERIKQEKRSWLVNEIDKQITWTLEKRKTEKQQQRQEDKNFQDFWRHKNHELEALEIADRQAYKQRCKNLQNYHQKQMDNKQKLVEKEILKEFDDALKMKAAVEEEDRVFSSYAERCLAEWDNNGKNLKPLLLELENYRKKAI